jgi:Uma2 family endonuclease
MASEPRPRLTIQEYLAFERQSEIRHEYLDGEMFAMSGATRKHNVIAGNIFGLIWTQFRGRACEVYTETMRVRTPADFVAYPDVAALCGERKIDRSILDTLLNPTLIVEVLSPPTEDYDRGPKLPHYQSIPSLSDCLLVAQDRVHVEHYQRQGTGGWRLVELDDPAQTLELASIGCRLALAEIYEKAFSE